MKITEQKEIESIEFAARVNIASDLDTFLRAIATEPSVRSLRQRSLTDPSMIDSLFKVMRHLIDSDFDPKYENPMDAALSTYGWIIASGRPDLEGLVGDLVGSLRNSWWANQLGNHYRTAHD